MTNHVVTWKKIADQANELYPKTLRAHTVPTQEDEYEYLAAAVI